MSLTNGLQSYYKLDEASGTTAFDSVGSNDGTNVGATIVTGKINNGLSFDGTNDYVSLGDVSDLEFTGNEMSWSVFVKWSKSPTLGTHIIDKNGFNGNGYRIFTGGSGTIRLNINSQDIDSLFIPTTGVWYHIVVSHKSGEQKIYINNELEVTKTISTSLGLNTRSCVFGVRSDSITTSLFGGVIDEIGAWNRVLTQAEVTELYSNGDGNQYPFSTPPPPQTTLTNGLQSYYKLDETSGTTAFDSVGTNDGTASHTGILGSAGKINNGGTFNGSTNRITGGNILGGENACSFSFFMNSSGTNYYSGLIRQNHSSQNLSILVRVNNVNKINVRIQSSTGGLLEQLSSVSNVLDGNWKHISITYNASNIKIYINGIEDNTKITTSPITFNAHNLRIGHDANPYVVDNRYFNGLIDEVGIWNRALTQAEITELYNNGDGLSYPFAQPTTKKGNIFFGFGGGKELAPVNPVPVPLAYYTLDEGSGTTAFDSVGTNDINLIGPTIVTGKINNGLDFDGSNDYGTVNNLIPSGATRTFSLWVNPDDISGGTTFSTTNPRYFYNGGGGTAARVGIRLLGGYIDGFAFNSSATLFQFRTSTEVMTVGSWQHIVYVLEPNQKVKIYRNAVLQTMGSGFDDIYPTTIQSQNTFNIGRQTNNTRYLNGKLDEVGIWNEALTQEHITYLYNNGNGARPNLS